MPRIKYVEKLTSPEKSRIRSEIYALACKQQKELFWKGKHIVIASEQSGYISLLYKKNVKKI